MCDSVIDVWMQINGLSEQPHPLLIDTYYSKFFFFTEVYDSTLFDSSLSYSLLVYGNTGIAVVSFRLVVVSSSE